MLARLIVTGFLCLFVAGCATTEKPAPTTETQASAPEKEKSAPEVKDPCQVMLDELVKKSVTTSKTVTGTCQGNQIEVTPMWGLDYDGSVHVRVYDASGRKIKDEFKKPAKE
ncbi:MAG: hypothetical protein HY885_14040 [Deltaproteobacteria bacterium]|nr:hypothetical protein [Deltaproteobacteria bacterium]